MRQTGLARKALAERRIWTELWRLVALGTDPQTASVDHSHLKSKPPDLVAQTLQVTPQTFAVVSRSETSLINISSL